MKLLAFAALLAALCVQSESQGILGNVGAGFGNIFGISPNTRNPCDQDPLSSFHDALSQFSLRVMKRVSYYANGPFIISPYSIWLSLGTISEFADPKVQRELFTALNLPQEKCLRDKFYQIALSLETGGAGVTIMRNRAIAIDNQLVITEEWKKYTQATNYLTYFQVPFNAESFQNVPATMNVNTPIAFDGHSIILDRLDFEGLWSSVFSRGSIERAPFYNDFGQEVAAIDFIKVKTRVRHAYIPIINAKILELPIGSDGRYSMLFTMGVNNNTVKKILDLLMSSIIVDIMSALTMSLIPIEVAIPKFTVTAGFDDRLVLEDLGLGRIFRDPDVTRYISNPPALPSGYLQKVTLNITSGFTGNFVRNPPGSTNILSGFFNMASNAATELASAVGRDFIANKPFIYNLIDTKTKLSLFSGVYSYEVARKIQDLPLSRNG